MQGLAQQQPRVYPQRFGVEMCKLMPKLKSEGEGMVGSVDCETPAYVLLKNYEMSDWPEADLKEVVRYLYGNKHLKLPSEWKQAFPTRI